MFYPEKYEIEREETHGVSGVQTPDEHEAAIDGESLLLTFHNLLFMP